MSRPYPAPDHPLINVAEAEALVGKIGSVSSSLEPTWAWPGRYKITGFTPYPKDPTKVRFLQAEDVVLNDDETAVVEDVGADGRQRRIALRLPHERFGRILVLPEPQP